MYYRGQGIRKSSHPPRSRSQRFLRFNALTAVKQEAQRPNSVPSPSTQDALFFAPDSLPKTPLTHLRSTHETDSFASSGSFGHASELNLSTEASTTSQNRPFSTPEFLFWPPQSGEVFGNAQLDSARASFQHLLALTSEIDSPVAAMSAFGQVLHQSPVSHFGHEQDYYSSVYPTTSVDYNTGLFAFQSPESLALPVHKNSSPVMNSSTSSYRESPALSRGRSIKSSRAPSPTSIRASRISEHHSETPAATQPGGAHGDILAYASQAPQSQGLGLVAADIAVSRPETSPFLSPGYFIDENENGPSSSNASTVSSDAASYYSTSLPTHIHHPHQPQYLIPQSYEFGSSSPGLASQPASSSTSLFPGHGPASNITRHSVGSLDPSHLPVPGSTAVISPETLYHSSSTPSTNLHSSTYSQAPYSSNPIRLLSPSPRPPPQCFEHGCGGRQFSTFSNLLRHQREKSGKASKSVCPSCGGVFTRTTARNGHLRGGKCRGRTGASGNSSLDSRRSMERAEDRRNSGDGH